MRWLWLLIPLQIWGGEDFISDYEYGQMLYANAGGISCAQCHGKSGEGKVIVSYRDGDKEKVLKGSDIRQISLSQMIEAVNSYHEIMPRYYMTNEEVKAIYEYMQTKNKAYLDAHKKKTTP